MKQRKRLFVTIILLPLVSFLILLWVDPIPPFDRSLVDPELLEALHSAVHVESSYFLDGGSIGVELEDESGKTISLFFQVSNGKTRRSYRSLAYQIVEGRPQTVTAPEELRATTLAVCRLLKRHRSDYRFNDWHQRALRESPGTKIEGALFSLLDHLR